MGGCVCPPLGRSAHFCIDFALRPAGEDFAIISNLVILNLVDHLILLIQMLFRFICCSALMICRSVNKSIGQLVGCTIVLFGLFFSVACVVYARASKIGEAIPTTFCR